MHINLPNNSSKCCSKTF